MEPIITNCFSTKRFETCGRKNWGELFMLYSDGTWEKIFEYRWKDPFKAFAVNAVRFKRKTRAKAIEILEKDYYTGRLEGVFMDEKA